MRRESLWRLHEPVNIPADLLAAAGHDKIIAGYLVQRGITSPEEASRFLNPDRRNLADPFDLPEMLQAMDRLEKALATGEKIGIWGDFDMDGQTATSVLVECLTKLGAEIDYYLPVRGRETHGIAITSLEVFLNKGIRLLVTCDTGISEVEAVQYAAGRDVDVIITDHHTLPEEMPAAVARINPRCLPEDHALGSLSGSAAAFELMLALCRRLNREEVAFESIDLAAIGLIADLAPLKKDSRLITQLGLERLNKDPRKFVSAIFNAAGSKINTIDEQTIGYTIAPRLNAAGRLHDANPFVKFLTGQLSGPEMKTMAEQLEALNANRKWLSDQVYQSATGQIERQPQIAEQPVIIVSHPAWEGGVLGLAAGHLVKDYNRPAIVLRETADGRVSGSARSVEGIDITRAISAAAPLLAGFGGHPMAAGLSLQSENLPEFKRLLFHHVLGQGLDPEAPPVLELDEELNLAQVTPEFHTAIRRLAPFGKENPPLLFCSRRVRISGTRALGRTREHFQFQLEDEHGGSMQAVWWNTDESSIPDGWFDLAFSLSINEYKGKITYQGDWTDFHRVEDPQETPEPVISSGLLDFRAQPDPLTTARVACRDGDLLIYQEPYDLDDPVSCGRDQLHPAASLILSSIPPSWQIFAAVISRVNPQRIYLVFDRTPDYTTASFVKQLFARLRYAVDNRDGVVASSDLAQSLNARLETVQLALRWLESAGKISIETGDTQLMRVQFTNSTPSKEATLKVERDLDYLLKDTTAFQREIKKYDTNSITAALSSLKPKTRN